MDNPCKGCERRHIGCHSGCEDYKRTKEWYAKKAEGKKKQDDSTPDMSNELKRKMWRGMRWK